MSISSRDLRLLYQQSGNRCAFPDCMKQLTFPASAKDDVVSKSEIAHIVAESLAGPRGQDPMPLEDRDRYENLMLLCEEHHHLVDQQVATYPVEKLRGMKYDHEALIAEATRRAVEARAGDRLAAPSVVERVYSSLLPVEQLPRYVYSVDCDLTEKEVRDHLLPAGSQFVSPYIVRASRLFCFQDLRTAPGAFAVLARGRTVQRAEANSWWDDNDRARWQIDLLNRTLNKVCGRRGLHLDRLHRRYYFAPDEPGKPKKVKYRPMNVGTSEISVVWQPITTKTQLPKKFWYHRAIALSFQRTGQRQWCLAMRPEMRVTRDGVEPLVPKNVGRKVTRAKSRMFNIDVLEELNFWREFFFEDRPRLVVTFSEDAKLSVSGNFLAQLVTWPGVPPECARTYKNAMKDEGLFDLLERDALGDADDDDSEWAESEESKEEVPDAE